MSSPHVGDDAELYAFGALDASERATVEAHINVCDDCLRRVGRAEETLLAMEREAQPQAISDGARWRARAGATFSVPAWIAAAAVAAAFAFGLLLPRGQAPDNEAHLALLQSHFSHAQFRGTPLAKVIYPRERSWYYVIVQGPVKYDVYGVTQSQRTALGTTVPSGATSELFVRRGERFDRIELHENGTVVEAAAIR